MPQPHMICYRENECHVYQQTYHLAYPPRRTLKLFIGYEYQTGQGRYECTDCDCSCLYTVYSVYDMKHGSHDHQHYHTVA